MQVSCVQIQRCFVKKPWVSVTQSPVISLSSASTSRVSFNPHRPDVLPQLFQIMCLCLFLLGKSPLVSLADQFGDSFRDTTSWKRLLVSWLCYMMKISLIYTYLYFILMCSINLHFQVFEAMGPFYHLYIYIYIYIFFMLYILCVFLRLRYYLYMTIY